MLNIKRRPHEAVVITCPDGTRLGIIVLGIQGSQVKIAFDAPTSFVIDRWEVDYRKAREATGAPLQGQEPRGPDWTDHREREG